jgi:hypothetical protein
VHGSRRTQEFDRLPRARKFFPLGSEVAPKGVQRRVGVVARVRFEIGDKYAKFRTFSIEGVPQ